MNHKRASVYMIVLLTLLSLFSYSKLALEVAVAAEPLLDILVVTLEPIDLGANGVEALLNSTVEAL
jgi:hypothetical protein